MATNLPPNPQEGKEYVYPNCGPWGVTVDQALATQSRLNSTFSETQWQNAKMDGCLPQPGLPYPQWPPPPNTFIYPTLQKGPTQVLDLGVRESCPQVYKQDPPYQTNAADEYPFSSLVNYMNQPNQPSVSNVMNFTNPSNCPAIGIQQQPLPPSLSSSQYNEQNQKKIIDNVVRQILHLPPTTQQQQQQQESQQQEYNKKKDSENQPINVSSSSSLPLSFSSSASPTSSSSSVSCQLQNNPEYSFSNIFSCLLNTIQGVVYDIGHWKDVPGPTFSQKLSFTFTREDRGIYLLIWVIVLFGLLTLLSSFFTSKKQLFQPPVLPLSSPSYPPSYPYTTTIPSLPK